MARSIGRVGLCALALALPLGFAGQADAEVVHCGDVITHSVDVSNNLTNCPGDGLDVGANGVTVRLLGHTISAAANTFGTGIRMTAGISDVRLIGGAGNSITGFDNGVLIDRGARNTVQGIQTRQGNEGIHIGGGVGNLIDGSTERDSRHVGVWLQNFALPSSVVVPANNTISHNTVIGAEFGVEFDGEGRSPTRNILSNSTISGTEFGVIVGGSENTVAYNSLLQNKVGLEDAGASDTIKGNSTSGGQIGFSFICDSLIGPPDCASFDVYGNKARGAAYGFDVDGLFVTGTFYDNRAEGNRVGFRLNQSGDSSGGGILLDRNQAGSGSCQSGGTDGNGIGILVRDAMNTTLSGNRACNNRTSVTDGRSDGIHVESSTNTVLTNNIANFNLGDGIYVSSSGGTLKGNTAHRNTGFGIEAFGVTDGGHNSAVDDPLGGCVGLACTGS